MINTLVRAFIRTDSLKSITLRWHLILLVLAVALPLLGFSSILILQQIRNQHETVERGLRDTARALSSAADREIAKARLVLETLAASQYLDREDFRLFHDLSSVAAAKFEGARIILFALDGQQLTNTLRPYGTALPNPLRAAEPPGQNSNYPDLPISGFEPLREVIKTNRPVISDMFIALSNLRPCIAIDIPVMRGGKLLYVLDMTLGPEVFGKLIAEQHMVSGWYAAIFDRRGMIIAGGLEPEKFIGRRASAELLKQISVADEGSGRARTLEGVPLYSAFIRSKATGWVTATGVSQSIADAQINRTLFIVLGVGALIVLCSIAGAAFLGRILAKPIMELAGSAESLQRGEPVEIHPPEVVELKVLRDALITAGMNGRSAAQERERRLLAEARETETEAARAALLTSEAQMAAEAKSLARLNELSSRLWGMPTLSQGLGEMLEATIELLGADMGNVKLLDPNRRVLVIVAQRGFQQDFLDFFEGVTAEHESASGRALRSGKRIIIEDVESDSAYEPFRPIARAAGYRAVQSTPLIGWDGTLLGMLSTHFRKVHRPSEHELRGLDLYSRQAVDFIEHCRSEGALRLSEHNLKRELDAAHHLQRVSTHIMNGDGSQALYEEILDAAVAIMRSDFASIQMLYPERGPMGELRLLGHRGFDAHATRFWEWVCPDSNSTCSMALRTGERVFVSDVTKCGFMAGSDDLRTCLDTGIHAVQTTPLVSRTGALVGMISTHWRESHESTAADLRLFDVLARLAADIIQHKRAEEERAEHAERLQEADKRKDEFIAILSHELRNPLAPIRNAVEIMKQPNVNAKHFQLARDIIDNQLNQMVRLIDDLLDISRISRGKIELKKQRVTLQSIVDQALETSLPYIEANGHKLTLSLPPEAVYLDADLVRLAQVLSNLINNACKYSEKNGNIEVVGELVATERDGATRGLTLSVKDSGIGIAPEHLPSLFKMFSQVDSAQTRAQGGLGIGLSLVRALVEMHGGTVEARSEGLGKGSEFILRLRVLEIVGPGSKTQGGSRSKAWQSNLNEISEAGNHRSTKESYRDHVITSLAIFEPDMNCWRASSTISWKSEKDWHQHKMVAAKMFESESRAIAEGLTIARCWIDGKL